MAQLIRETVEGKARLGGRPFLEWVPSIVSDLVAVCDPLQVILRFRPPRRRRPRLRH